MKKSKNTKSKRIKLYYNVSEKEVRNLIKEFKNLKKEEKEKLTIGQKIADVITKFGGSWSFIFILAGFLVGWMILNTALIIFGKWDPYPFILLNLFLSFLAAFQAPVILMSQNREAERDRKRAQEDFIINQLAQREIEDMQNDLDEIKEKLNRLLKQTK